MKFISAVALFSTLGAVYANPLVEKRATTSDKATIGYATLSGGYVLTPLIQSSQKLTISVHKLAPLEEALQRP